MPGKQISRLGYLLSFLHWKILEHFNAARMRAAGEGLTEPLLYFLPHKPEENANESLSASEIPYTLPALPRFSQNLPRFFFHRNCKPQTAVV